VQGSRHRSQPGGGFRIEAASLRLRRRQWLARPSSAIPVQFVAALTERGFARRARGRFALALSASFVQLGTSRLPWVFFSLRCFWESIMPGRRRSWTEDDIAKLKSLAGKRPGKLVAAELGRSRGATAVLAHRLGVSLRYHVVRIELPRPRPMNTDLGL